MPSTPPLKSFAAKSFPYMLLTTAASIALYAYYFEIKHDTPIPIVENVEHRQRRKGIPWNREFSKALNFSKAIGERDWLLNDTAPSDPSKIGFCGEECRYMPRLCSETLYQISRHPAPFCLNRSSSLDDDIFSKPSQASADSYRATMKLVKWGARRSRRNPFTVCEELLYIDRVVNGRRLNTTFWSGLMFPDEFEMITKTLVRLKPQTFLLWGLQNSLQYYPLMVAGKTTAIDIDRRVCDTFKNMTLVKCVDNVQKRLIVSCYPPKRSLMEIMDLADDGSPKTVSDAISLAPQYVGMIEVAMGLSGLKTFDVAIISNRFRAICALKLLNFVTDKSIVIIHDFWPHYRTLKVVLTYYDLIGYARGVGLFRRKPLEQLPKRWETAFVRNMPTTNDDQISLASLSY